MNLPTALLFAGLALPALAAGKPAAKALSYERDVLPLFQARCGACHGAAQTRAGLDVRTVGDLLEGGGNGPAVVAGSPEKSLLYQMLADGRMPKGGRLSSAELKRVADWIRAGARGEHRSRHWAFIPPVQAPVPKVRGNVRSPIDAFLLADLQRRGLSFSPEADRRALIRRVTYDLTGLPPTPEEVQAFLDDRSPKAYEKVVDRLLASPQYGERWARYWLDPAGYADSEGVLQEDRVRSNMWRYRDYVIRSFNADEPYDQFLREQLAGDELVDYRHAEKFTPEIIETLTATGFLRTAVDATRDDFNPHQYGEYQYRMLTDLETIVFSSAVGLTIQCSRCHNHKYEPISQKDYYRVQALFMGAVRPRGSVLPTYRRQIVAGGTAEQKSAADANAKVDAAVAEINGKAGALLLEYRLRALSEGPAVPEADRASLAAAVQVEEAKRTPEQKGLAAKYKAAFEIPADQLVKRYPAFREADARLGRDRADQEKRRVVLPEIRAFYDLDATPPPTPLLVRGDWLHPGDPVAPGIPAVLDDPQHPFTVPAAAPGAETTGRRRAFAEWLTRPEHPLTPRVIVNRVWAHHFGVGIVPSTDNFGRTGQPPSNQPLLDWLAVGLTRGINSSRPWTLKALHRLIVTSAAYRQQSAWRADAAKVDPDDRLLWRQRPRRLEAEAIRDGVLAAAGTLDPAMFGEPVPLETRPTGETVPAGEEGRGRRSIYLLVRRTTPVNLLNAFDAPVMETNCTRRMTSTTPTQALALMNSGFIAAQAGNFARRILKETDGDPARVNRAFQLAFSRAPAPAERSHSLAFLRAQISRYQSAGDAPGAADEKAWADLCQALLSANEFAYVD